MYFADLTPYGYCGQPSEGRVNVGWLGDVGFETGEVPSGFVDALKRLKVENLYRGSHYCHICCSEKFKGNGEFRLSGYAAPVLVVHYVEDHKYLPPAGFIEAVMSA